MHAETNIIVVGKLWMEDGVKDMEMWNTCRNQHNCSWQAMDGGWSKRYGNVKCMQKPT